MRKQQQGSLLEALGVAEAIRVREARWRIDRWRKSSAYREMSAEEQGVYRNLLDELWLRDGAIPDDEVALAKIGNEEAWPRVRETVLARFRRTPRGLTHETHDEIARAGYDGPTSADVEDVFAHWKERMSYPKAKLTPERAVKIRARLTQGYTVEQLKRAIDGCAMSAYHRGDNDRGRAYDEIELICRNGSKVEQFLRMQPRPLPL